MVRLWSHSDCSCEACLKHPSLPHHEAKDLHKRIEKECCETWKESHRKHKETLEEDETWEKENVEYWNKEYAEEKKDKIFEGWGTLRERREYDEECSRRLESHERIYQEARRMKVEMHEGKRQALYLGIAQFRDRIATEKQGVRETVSLLPPWVASGFSDYQTYERQESILKYAQKTIDSESKREAERVINEKERASEKEENPEVKRFLKRLDAHAKKCAAEQLRLYENKKADEKDEKKGAAEKEWAAN